jgi:RimJ/RimL family protein N-acetyltransferase
MAVIEPREKDEIAACLRRNGPARFYELGDLDDFDWLHTRWFGMRTDGVLDEVVLLYTEPVVPVLLAIADAADRPMRALLDAIVDTLPPTLYAHATPSLVPVLERRFRVVGPQPHVKLALTRTDLLGACAVDAEQLRPDDLDEIEAFYRAAYPDTWFSPRMLATGRYVGIRRDGRLACVAGVHVYSPTWRVAALGNVATHPRHRGKGLAQGACARLCELLLHDGIETIALNVRRDNAAARTAYARLGFEQVAEYIEASLITAD